MATDNNEPVYAPTPGVAPASENDPSQHGSFTLEDLRWAMNRAKGLANQVYGAPTPPPVQRAPQGLKLPFLPRISGQNLDKVAGALAVSQKMFGSPTSALGAFGQGFAKQRMIDAEARAEEFKDKLKEQRERDTNRSNLIGQYGREFVQDILTRGRAVKGRRHVLTDADRKYLREKGIAVPDSIKDVPEEVMFRDMPILTPPDERGERLAAMKDKRSAKTTIMTQYRLDPDVKRFNMVKAYYDQARTARDQPQTTLRDLILIRQLARISDPESSVREKEFETFEDAQGWLISKGMVAERAFGRGSLTEQGVKDVTSLLAAYYRAARNAYVDAVDFYTGLAREWELDPATTVRGYSSIDAIRSEDISPAELARRRNK